MLQGFFPLNGQSIGEGSVVRLVAWILNAHVSDCATGENVNCETPGFASDDLHIPLLEPKTAGRTQDECSSVTAEMSPHFRPASWSNLDLKTPVKRVVRVTGPLFFDNAHKPCGGLSKAATDKAPFRSSIWEIHPVYQLEVCSSAIRTKCKVDSNDPAIWIPYDQWVADASNKQAMLTTGQTYRTAKSCRQPAAPGAGVVAAACPN